MIPAFPNPTWFVGAGHMGGAMIDGWRSAGLDLAPVRVIRPSGTPVEGAAVVTRFADAGPPPRLVVLGFKPQQLGDIAPQLKNWMTSKTIVVSILAGVEAATLRALLPNAGVIVRAMPNLPVAVRRGVVAMYSAEAGDTERKALAELMAPLGFAPWMADEARLAAVGAVAGAGPAYAARFIAALTKAGERSGLSREIASTVALETVLGTAWMAAASGEAMADIARRVASPNGTTEAGLAVLDRDAMLDNLIAVTIEAAARRGQELADAAKGALLADPVRLH